MSYIKNMETNRNELGVDAWGRNKMITDHSLFHGIFTYDVPVARWKEYVDDVEQVTFVNATSLNGMLNITSNTNKVYIASKRHPRYQPNRGHLYSVALNVPTPNNEGYIKFGLLNADNSVHFKCEGNGVTHSVYAEVVRDSVVVYTEELTLPDGFDVSKGHVYDIQMQWRGVGNFKFFVDLELVHTAEFLGTLDYLSTSNPALPVAFECGSVSSTYAINVGCVDVTSEGGVKESRTYNSLTTGELLPTETTPTAMLAYRIPDTYNGKLFTRDTVLTRMTSFCKDEAMHALYYGRAVNLPNLSGLTWDTDPISLNNSLVGGNGSLLDEAFTLDIASMHLVYEARHEKDFAKVTEPAGTSSEFLLSAGDIIVVSLHSDAANNGGITLELDVEI